MSGFSMRPLFFFLLFVALSQSDVGKGSADFAECTCRSAASSGTSASFLRMRYSLPPLPNVASPSFWKRDSLVFRREFRASEKRCQEGVPRRRLFILDWSDRLVPYDLAWRIQHALLELQLQQLENGTLCDFAILQQHPSVYTLGQGASQAFLGPSLKRQCVELHLPEALVERVRSSEGLCNVLSMLQSEIARRGIVAGEEVSECNPEEAQVFRVERGGQVTWHGRGQLVLYPIFDLRMHRTDVRWFVEALEESAAQVLKKVLQTQSSSSAWKGSPFDEFGTSDCILGIEDIKGCPAKAAFLKLQRHHDMPGVWADGAKICAVGIRIRRWICFHGAALNVCNSLGSYNHIVACGLRGKTVTNVVKWMQKLKEQISPSSLLCYQQSEGTEQTDEKYNAQIMHAAALAWKSSLEATFGFGSVETVRNLEEIPGLLSKERAVSAGEA